MLKTIFNWIFKSQLAELQSQIDQAKNVIELGRNQTQQIKNLFDNTGISVDVHEFDHKYSPSWAVISIQGETSDFIKFIDLGRSDVQMISSFLHQFERLDSINIDASPNTSKLLRMNKRSRTPKYF